MRAYEELVQRLCLSREEKLGGLSDGARDELEMAVRADPTTFIDTPGDEAFALVVQALERYESSAQGEDLLDDEAYFAARAARLARLESDCKSALTVDSDCLEAALVCVLARDLEPERLLGELIELADQTKPADQGADKDQWYDVRLRSRLRLEAAISRTCLDSARYRMAAKQCEQLLRKAPSDVLGARHTCLLAYARLEDEDAFDAVDVRFSRQGSAWRHLAHTILLYKLGRMGAAKRALDGYARLCTGGAYALLRPIIVDVYIPDRPESASLSFEEATLAVNEADPIIMDVPDFISWAQTQGDLLLRASDFAERNGLDW